MVILIISLESYVTSVYLDNKLISLGDGKSKSDAKNSAALYALKYLLSLDESCLENARFIATRCKKGSNSKPKNSATKDSLFSAQKSLTSLRNFAMEEEVKIENMDNFMRKRKGSNVEKLSAESENLVRKKLQ